MIFHFFRGQPFLNENQNHGVGTSRSWDLDILQWAVPFALSTESHPKKNTHFLEIDHFPSYKPRVIVDFPAIFRWFSSHFPIVFWVISQWCWIFLRLGPGGRDAEAWAASGWCFLKGSTLSLTYGDYNIMIIINLRGWYLWSHILNIIWGFLCFS